MARAELERALREAGDDPAHTAHLRRLVAAELERSRAELTLKRSGYVEPVTVLFAAELAVAPVDAALRVDPAVASERGQELAAAVFEALGEAGDGEVRAGDWRGFLAVEVPGADPELALLAFEEAMAGVDRLRAAGLVAPLTVLDARDLRPLSAYEEAHEIRPHDDPDPRRRAARRILQRLRGMGKWGGYHTEFAHLARGFEGNERALALDVGEALVASGLLLEKPSVGQRHVCLNPRRAGTIHRLIDDGAVPEELTL